jgi:ATP-dependent helicase/DNAse subunit B
MEDKRSLTQLSPSKLTTYMTCPIKFYARYILGIKSRPTAGMLLGRAVHKALELLGRRRQLELGVTQDDVLTEFHESWRDEITTSELELSADESSKTQAAGERMLGAYWQRFSGEKPVSSELKLEEPLVNPATGEVYAVAGDLNMVGIVDSLVAEDDGLVIVDFKTTAKTSSPVSVALTHRIQMLAYAYLLRQATDQRVKALEVRQIVSKKEPEVALVRIPLADKPDFGPLFLVVDALLDSLRTNRWMPRYNFMCSSACEGFARCSGS